MSSSGDDHSKKRKTDDDVGVALSLGRGGGDALARELMSAMNTLLDQNRLLLDQNRRMESKMDSMERDMKGQGRKQISKWIGWKGR